MAELLRHTLATYLSARAAQQRDHTDTALNDARTEAHDELLWQLTLADRECERDEAVSVAREILDDPTKKIGDKTLNTRQDWEITVAIHCQNAVMYLKLLELDATKVRIYETAYKTEDIEQWAKIHAETQIRKANEKANEQGIEEEQCQAILAIFAKDEVAGDAKSVMVADQCTDICVPPVKERAGPYAQPVAVLDTTRCGTLLSAQAGAQAKTYIDAEAAWWSSLVSAPYNSRKDDSHAALDAERHQAFLAFGAGIAVAKELTK